MKTTPRSYYWHLMVPNYQDYLRDPEDALLAFNVATPEFQLADIFYRFYEREDSSVIQN